MTWKIIQGKEVVGNYENIEQAKYRLHVYRLLGGDGFIWRFEK